MNEKVILITGASSGIGLAVAEKYAAAGHRLVLVARRQERLLALANHFAKKYQTQTLIIKCDMQKADEIERMVAKAIDYFGQIDVLVSSAGYGLFKPYDSFTYDEYQSMFATNTLGMMYVARLLADHMKEYKQGKILFVVSIAGKLATPSSSVYSASKFAMIGYANALRLELAPFNIDVTTANFGPVATDFFQHDKQMISYYNKIKQFSLSTEQAANYIFNALNQGRKAPREINQPHLLKLAYNLYQIFPTIGDQIILKFFDFK